MALVEEVTKAAGGGRRGRLSLSGEGGCERERPKERGAGACAGGTWESMSISKNPLTFPSSKRRNFTA